MITLLHNPRCGKSREALQLLETRKADILVIRYLDEPLNKTKLKQLIRQLGISPIELVRTGEPIWKEHYKGKKLSDVQIIEALQKYPKLIERPIAIKGQKAVIGRPPETVLTLL